MSSSDWTSHRLGDIVDDVAMGPFGSNIKTDNFIDKGVPVIRGANLNDGGFDNEKFVFVSEEKAQSLRRSLAYPDDLVFTHRGTIGQVGIIPHGEHPKYLVSQSQMRLTVNKKFLDPRFLYYFFKSPLGQYELLKNRSQVGVPAIASPTTSLKDVDISIPNLHTQKRIAGILSALDEKIELNRQTNATLEAIAQAIFKEWFVHYNYPVLNYDWDDYMKTMKAGGANHSESGNQFNHSTDMIDSELGMIPAGWRVVTLEDVTSKIGSGATPSGGSGVYISEGVNLIRSQNVYDSEFVWSGLVHITEEHAEKLKNVTLKNGDVLINITGDSILRTCTVDDSMLPGRVNQHVAIVRPKSQIPTHFLHQFLLLPATKGKMLSMSSGATRKALTKSTLENLEIILPAQNCLEAFENLTNPLFSRIQCNSQESRFLAQIRDTLLPKLMRGEVV